MSDDSPQRASSGTRCERIGVCGSANRPIATANMPLWPSSTSLALPPGSTGSVAGGSSAPPAVATMSNWGKLAASAFDSSGSAHASRIWWEQPAFWRSAATPWSASAAGRTSTASLVISAACFAPSTAVIPIRKPPDSTTRNRGVMLASSPSRPTLALMNGVGWSPTGATAATSSSAGSRRSFGPSPTPA